MNNPIHDNPLSAWKHLCDLGGLELDGRDEGLDERILSRLNPRASSVEKAIAGADMASFVRAFFEALHPYVAMFRDILDFFENADATQGKAQWVLQVDDIDLSLEHFRQWLAAWDSLVREGMPVPAIDAKAGWRLWRILEEQPSVADELQKTFQKKPLNISDDVQRWISTYNQGTYSPLPQSLSPSQCPPELRKSASIAFAVIQRLLDRKVTPSDLKNLYLQHSRDVHSQGKSDIYDHSDGFDFWTIAQHETDLWLRSFVVALSAASQLPKSKLKAIGEELDKITDQFPLRHEQVTVSVSDLESVLSLPIWEKRYDLYSVWIATEIIRALTGHDVEIHHDNGCIAFAFKETTIATIHSSPGPFKLISERRIPLANPQGKGRKEGVQPDHGLWTMKDGHEVCKMVIEVKHYKKSSKAKFLDVFEDYARAIPNGDIYLVNHGPIGKAINNVSGTIRNRCTGVGHLTSSNIEARKELTSAVYKCVGEPIPRWPATTQTLGNSIVLLVDVSGSMNTSLRSEAMNSFVRQLASKELPAKLVAADEKIIGEWETSEAGFCELLRLTGDGTNLNQPVAELLKSYERVLVITDKEGVATIQGANVTAYALSSALPSGIEVRVCRKR